LDTMSTSLLKFFNKDASFALDGSGPRAQDTPAPVAKPQPKVATPADSATQATQGLVKKFDAGFAKLFGKSDVPVQSAVKETRDSVRQVGSTLTKANATLTLTREDENRNALMLRETLERLNKRQISAIRDLISAVKTFGGSSSSSGFPSVVPLPMPGRKGSPRGVPIPPALPNKKTPVPEKAPDGKKTAPASGKGGAGSRIAQAALALGAAVGVGAAAKGAKASDAPEGVGGSGNAKAAPAPAATPRPMPKTETKPVGFVEGALTGAFRNNTWVGGDHGWVDPATKQTVTKTVPVAEPSLGGAGKAAPSKAGSAAKKVLSRIPGINLLFGGLGAADSYTNAADQLGMDESQLTEGNRRAAAVGGFASAFDPLEFLNLGSMASNALLGTNFSTDMSIGKTVLGYKNNADFANSMATKLGLVDAPKSAVEAQKQNQQAEDLTNAVKDLTKATEESADAIADLEEGLEAAGNNTYGAEQAQKELDALAKGESGPLMQFLSLFTRHASGEKGLLSDFAPGTPSAAASPGFAPEVAMGVGAGAVAGAAALSKAPMSPTRAGVISTVVGSTVATGAALMNKNPAATPATPSGSTKAAGNAKQLSKNPEVAQAIIDAAIARGEDPALMLAIADKESSFNPNAKPGINPATGKPYSSASGLYQFLTANKGKDGTKQSTWEAAAKGAGVDTSNPFDITANAKAGAYFTQNNRKAIEKHLGRKADTSEVYAAHFLGEKGAKDYLDAYAKNPNAIGAELFPDAAKSNPTVYYDKKGKARTLEELKKDFLNPMNEKTAAYATLLSQGAIPGSEKTAYAQNSAAPTVQTAQAAGGSTTPMPSLPARQDAPGPAPVVVAMAPTHAPAAAEKPIPPPPPATTAVATQPQQQSIPLHIGDVDILYG